VLSALRRKRIVHPHGVGYRAVFTVSSPVAEYADVPLLSRPGSHPATVRFSRSFGFPEPLPDLLGLTVRLENLDGVGRHADFPLISSLNGPLVHHLPAFALGFFRRSYSSLLLYRAGSKVRLVGAIPASKPARGENGALTQLAATASGGDVRFQLALAPLMGRWQAVGELRLAERLPDADTDRLAFNPVNAGGGIEPLGPLVRVRDAAYRGSQAGRGTKPGGTLPR
jgi:hypothetical protein